MAESLFRETLLFLNDIGMYDVILPFLLVFTIVFAVLEKTKVLGTSKVDGEEITRKNINAIVAFVMAFLVIGSTQLVSIINESMANIVLLLLLGISFMLLVGTFYGTGEFKIQDSPGWVKFFMFFMFIGIVVIFLNAMNWLDTLMSIAQRAGTEWVSSFLMLLVMAGFIYFITKDNASPKKKD